MLKLNSLAVIHECNFCHQSVRYESIEQSLGKTLNEYGFPYKLKDFETLSYKTYKCANCGSSDRDRLYKLYINKYEKFTKNTKILDFAPSRHIDNYLRSISSGYKSADLLIDTFDDKVDIMNMTIYKDNTFDFFICSHILEHVEDDQKAMSELYRVLKPGGRGILMTPIINNSGVQDEDPSLTDVSERWRRFAQDDHVRLYERKVFMERVKNSGFNLNVYGYWNLSPINLLKYGIALKSRLYVVRKGR